MWYALVYCFLDINDEKYGSMTVAMPDPTMPVVNITTFIPKPSVATLPSDRLDAIALPMGIDAPTKKAAATRGTYCDNKGNSGL